MQMLSHQLLQALLYTGQNRPCRREQGNTQCGMSYANSILNGSKKDWALKQQTQSYICKEL